MLLHKCQSRVVVQEPRIAHQINGLETRNKHALNAQKNLYARSAYSLLCGEKQKGLTADCFFTLRTLRLCGEKIFAVKN